MECIVSLITVTVLTFAAEALFWRTFTGLIRKRVLARLAKDTSHDFTKDRVLRSIILFWTAIAGGLIVAGFEAGLRYCPFLRQWPGMISGIC